MGWQWDKDDDLHQGGETHGDNGWVGLRMGKVSDWSDYFMGPIADLPFLLNQLGEKMGK